MEDQGTPEWPKILNQLGLGSYVGIFADEEFDDDTFLCLIDRDLEKLIGKAGPRQKLRTYLEFLKAKKNGLTEACRNSTIHIAEAEDKLLEFLQQHTPPGVCPLGGNSISVDRMFINKYMPRVAEHIHYRSIDVSTIKELVRRWHPKEYNDCPPKRFVHKTIADIEDSINELKYYKSKIFVTPTQ